MKKGIFGFCKKETLVLMILAGLCVPLFAQAPQVPDKAANSQPASADLTALQTANSLAQYGYSKQSASALIGAAEILAQIQTRSLGVQPEQSGTAGSDKEDKPEFTPASLLADARKLAAGDTTMIAWANEVEASLRTRTRGAVGGPRQGINTVNARSIQTFTFSFTANALAEIAVLGDGDTDLDLYVFDRNGNLITSDESYSGDAYVSFIPFVNGPWTVQVVNNGSVWNRYRILTN
jgi:hypothetical protein